MKSSKLNDPHWYIDSPSPNSPTLTAVSSSHIDSYISASSSSPPTFSQLTKCGYKEEEEDAHSLIKKLPAKQLQFASGVIMFPTGGYHRSPPEDRLLQLPYRIKKMMDLLDGGQQLVDSVSSKVPDGGKPGDVRDKSFDYVNSQRKADASTTTTLCRTGDAVSNPALATPSTDELRQLLRESDLNIQLQTTLSERCEWEEAVKELRTRALEADDALCRRVLVLATQLHERSSRMETAFVTMGKVLGALTNILVPRENIGRDVRPTDSDAKIILDKYGLSLDGFAAENLKSKLIQSLDLAERLKEERNHLDRKRDEYDLKYRELELKYFELLETSKKQELRIKEQHVETQTELSMKRFENDRLNLLLSELDTQVKNSKYENFELKNKIEDLKDELHRIERERLEEVSRLSCELKEKSSQLNVYEKIESAIDKMVVESGGKSDTFAISGVDFLPTSASRRLMQALEQTSKANKLEKELEEKKREIHELYDSREALREEVKSFKALVTVPVGTLITKISEKTTKISQLEAKVEQLEKELIRARSRTNLQSVAEKQDTSKRELETEQNSSGYIQVGNHREPQLVKTSQSRVFIHPVNKLPPSRENLTGRLVYRDLDQDTGQLKENPEEDVLKSANSSVISFRNSRSICSYDYDNDSKSYFENNKFKPFGSGSQFRVRTKRNGKSSKSVATTPVIIKQRKHKIQNSKSQHAFVAIEERPVALRLTKVRQIFSSPF